LILFTNLPNHSHYSDNLIQAVSNNQHNALILKLKKESGQGTASIVHPGGTDLLMTNTLIFKVKRIGSRVSDPCCSVGTNIFLLWNFLY